MPITFKSKSYDSVQSFLGCVFIYARLIFSHPRWTMNWEGSAVPIVSEYLIIGSEVIYIYIAWYIHISQLFDTSWSYSHSHFPCVDPSLKNSGFSHVNRHFPCFSHGFPSGEFEVYEITKNPIRLEVLRVGPVANHLPKPAHHIALLSHVGRFARANFWYIF